MPGATGSRVPVYDRNTLAAGQSIEGPAIIEERETTTVDSAGLDGDGRQDRLYLCAEGIEAMDGVELEILWSNLIGIVTERAKALQRIAFSPVVREAGDLACALFDRRGRMVAQANTGTPGHINSLAIAGAHLVRIFANNLKPGDVVTTNDPWLSAGHFFDITVLTPIFDGDRILAYIGSTIHHTDIGGYGIGAGARDVHEEGLWIPPLKLYNAGEPCPVLHAMIKSNVRTPDAVFGDLAAQVSSGQAASERLIAHVPSATVSSTSRSCPTRSSRARRRRPARRFRKLKAGTFHGESSFDVPGGAGHHAEIRGDHRSGRGRDPGRFHRLDRRRPRAASTSCSTTPTPIRPSRSAPASIPTCPTTPAASRRSRCIAPEGSILNCQYPAPVNARHVVGMYVPMPILKALYHVMPDRVLAEGSGAVWTMQIQGKRDDGRAVHLVDVQLFRRHGRARDQDRPERDLLSDRRRRGAGGDRRGGDAGAVRPQGIAARLRRRRRDARRRRPDHPVPLQTKDEWLLNAVASRVEQGPRGPGRRRAGRGRKIPYQRQAGARPQEAHLAAG